MKVKVGYDFDDVLLVPRNTSLNSRDEVNLECLDYAGFYPIISSPMKGVSGVALVEAMYENNCLGILHRFDTWENRIKQINELSRRDRRMEFGVAIGLRNFEEELRVARYYSCNVDKVKLICIDIANGYIPNLISAIHQIPDAGDFINRDIMTGNIATLDGAKALADAGVRFIRVGVGPGKLCITRNVAGVGVPQLTAIEECAKVKVHYKDVFIVADGGIRYSGDAVKAFAVGADFVMLGTLLAGTKEADNDGNLYGMASEYIQINFTKKVKSIEGLELKITDEKVPVKNFLDQFLYGIKSACTYLNAKSYLAIKDNAEFILAGKGSIKII